MKSKVFKFFTLVLTLMLLCFSMVACVSVNDQNNNNNNPDAPVEEEIAPPVDAESPVYTITLVYNANNLGVDLSELPTEIKIRFNEKVNLPTYSSNGIKGFVIDGWVDLEGKQFTATYYNLKSDLTLKAKWSYYA